MTARLLQRVDELGGAGAVEAVLAAAGSPRSAEHLRDRGGWISAHEAAALWEAATRVTHQRWLAYEIGAETARSLCVGIDVRPQPGSEDSAEGALVGLAERSADHIRSVTVAVPRREPGLVEVVHRPAAQLPAHAYHCDTALGMLEQAASSLELPAVRIEHEICAAFGAPECRYRIAWSDDAAGASAGADHADRLRVELQAMRERLAGMFETAADLVGSGIAGAPLERIAARTAHELGAARHLLVVRPADGQEPQVHGHGFASEDAQRLLAAAGTGVTPALQPSWLSAPIRSGEHDYGLLVVEPGAADRSREHDRELVEVYARYAAIALESATARLRAERRFEQTTSLLEFAREVSAAGSSTEVAQRLADSVRLVVDCDEVGVHLWDGAEFTMIGYRDYRALRAPVPELPLRWTPEPDEAAARLISDPKSPPVHVSLAGDSLADRVNLATEGLEAGIAVPLASTDHLLGMLFVAVRDRPERLRRTADLGAQLEALVAQATTTLENGRLMDVVLHQARHDQLTGLPNRLAFAEDLGEALRRARTDGTVVGLFYMDLDHFKPVNDRLGHDVGDELLIAVAGRLAAHAEGRMLAARLGGDEFALIARAAAADELGKIERRLRAALSEPFEAGGRELTLTVSVGRSVFPTEATDEDGLLRLADETMYLDKEVQRLRWSDRRKDR